MEVLSAIPSMTLRLTFPEEHPKYLRDQSQVLELLVPVLVRII